MKNCIALIFSIVIFGSLGFPDLKAEPLTINRTPPKIVVPDQVSPPLINEKETCGVMLGLMHHLYEEDQRNSYKNAPIAKAYACQIYQQQRDRWDAVACGYNVGLLYAPDCD